LTRTRALDAVTSLCFIIVIIVMKLLVFFFIIFPTDKARAEVRADLPRGAHGAAAIRAA
jgi:hypothetical protein